jgi:hypothetical protein
MNDPDDGLKPRMAAPSGIRSVRELIAEAEAGLRPPSIAERIPLRVLFAHDGTQSTCLALGEHVAAFAEDAGGEVLVAASAQDAAEHLRTANGGGAPIHLAVLCLDLLPAPLAATRLADFAIRAGVPVVLVTRSPRWLSAEHMLALPWLSPEATRKDIETTARRAMADFSRPADVDDLADERVSIGF